MGPYSADGGASIVMIIIIIIIVGIPNWLG